MYAFFDPIHFTRSERKTKEGLRKVHSQVLFRPAKSHSTSLTYNSTMEKNSLLGVLILLSISSLLIPTVLGFPNPPSSTSTQDAPSKEDNKAGVDCDLGLSTGTEGNDAVMNVD